MKIGCHAVMFAAKLATDTEEVIRQIGTTGFQGIEAGSRFIAIDNRQTLMTALQENHLELAAIHYGTMEWRANPEAAIKGAVEEAAFMSKNSSRNINMSFMPQEGDDFKALAKIFNEAALACKEQGVSFNYHNHAGEFANDGAFYYTLLEYAPDLNFAFDLGWVYRGGFDPLKVLREAEGRCHYVHLRDPDDGPNSIEFDGRSFYQFPELGYGKTDLKGQLAFLKEYLPDDGWCVVEYEMGEPDVQRYVRAKQVIDSLM